MGVNVLVGCGVEIGVVGMAWPSEQDRIRSVTAITSKRICKFEKEVLIYLLLADRILDLTQSFNFNGDLIAVL